jgi:hypothetical protein
VDFDAMKRMLHESILDLYIPNVESMKFFPVKAVFSASVFSRISRVVQGFWAQFWTQIISSRRGICVSDVCRIDVQSGYPSDRRATNIELISGDHF